MSDATIAILHTRIRTEERLLIEAFDHLGVQVDVVDARDVALDGRSLGRFAAHDVVLDRTVSLAASQTVGRVLESMGIRFVNRCRAIDRCSDKLRTNVALNAAGIPTPEMRVAVGASAALEAAEDLGYPVVLKPTIGSWGRLVARANDRDAAEAIIEHRAMLGSAAQQVFYIQEHVEKPGRDLRLFVVGGETIAGIARMSDHWVTNTARGASASGYEITPELDRLCRGVSEAVGADICAVDLFECPRRGLLVNEVNHSLEFRNSIEPTGVDIPLRIAENVVSIAQGRQAIVSSGQIGVSV
ncbi:MAG: lysine biosynthesis protein LysX [Planctomycetota bacterium]